MQPEKVDSQARLLRNCRRTGYVGTILGRRREISGIRENSGHEQRNQPEREAINMEIQGSAADLIKVAMIRIDAALRAGKYGTKMLLQVHDELVFEVPAAEMSAMKA